jgi:hypothetical protein
MTKVQAVREIADVKVIGQGGFCLRLSLRKWAFGDDPVGVRASNLRPLPPEAHARGPGH